MINGHIQCINIFLILRQYVILLFKFQQLCIKWQEYEIGNAKFLSL